MRYVEGFLIAIGTYVTALYLLGTFNIGDFRFYYGPDFSKSTMCAAASIASDPNGRGE